MIGSFYRIIGVYFVLLSTSWALPWFSPSHESQAYSNNQMEQILPDESIDFSGTWSGECDNKPAVSLTIKQDKDELSISYGYMKEQFILGEMKTTTSIGLTTSEQSNQVATLNHTSKALIFINSNLFRNNEKKLNVFFSKVVMSLNGGQITVKGQYYSTNDSVEEVTLDTLSCVYHRRGS